jgi:hypothetical protein
MKPATYIAHLFKCCAACLLMVVSISSAQAQISADSADALMNDTIVLKDWKLYSPEALADTAWWALQQKTNYEFLSLVPTLAVLKETFDSLEIKNNPQVIRIKYNYISRKVGKQLKQLQSKAKRNSIKFKTSEYERFKVKEGKDSKGNGYAYITLECRKGKKIFYIKFVALQLNKGWYIADELRLEFPEDDPYYKPPVKVKRKD